MKTRIVHTKIWQDEWFCSIPRASKIIFLYLITCQQNNLCSIFELPDRILAFDTTTTQPEIDQAKKDLVNKALFYKGWVKLLKSEKYNNYITNPKLELALQKELNLIPQEIKDYFNGYDTSIHTSIYTPNNHKSKIINNNKGGVGGKESVGEVEMLEIANKYSVPESFVKSKWEDVVNWEAEKPGRMRGRNWKLTLMNWVKRDAIKIKGGQNVRRVGVVTIPE